MSIIERLTAIIAPDDCLSCGREGSLVCLVCVNALPLVRGYCFGCYAKVSLGVACDICLGASGLVSLQAVSSYEGVSRMLIAALKFRGNQSAARIIAECMDRATKLPKNTVLVHMPATTAHIRQRGYDQSALIARQLSRLSSHKHVSALRRIGQHHQLGSGRDERLTQLQSALSVCVDVRGCQVILIDDVLTTGASLHAAASVLLAAGAASVGGLVFGQALDGVH